MPLGRSATNDEQQPLRAALGQLLSKGTVLRLHLPLMVPQFTATLRQYAPPPLANFFTFTPE